MTDVPVADVSTTQAAAVPEALLPLSWLIGRWAGVGLGQYPSIEDFRFAQEVAFWTDGRPFLSYTSRTWLLDDDGNQVKPLATESGFWRPQPGNRLEVTMAHPTGYSEIWYGHVEVTSLEPTHVTGARIEMRTDLVARTESAKDYSAGHRLYGLVGGELMWTFDMAAMGHELQNHLSARLKPVADGAETLGDSA